MFVLAVAWTGAVPVVAGEAQAAPPGPTSPGPIEPPVLVEPPKVIYPKLAGERVLGRVRVELTITVDAEGRARRKPDSPPSIVVEGDELASPDDEAIFVAEAEAWIAALVFRPATLGGAPVAVDFPIEVVFEAPEPEPEPLPEPDEPPPEPLEPPPEPDEPPPEDELELEVVGDRQAPPVASASDYDVALEPFRAVPRRSAEEQLSLAPGILLTNPGAEGHPSTIFLRGFDAGEGQDLEFTVDGVPINQVANPHGHGLVDTNWIIPELVERVRVLEGPFDARQGDFAVAGSVDYRINLPGRGVRVSGGYGSFDRKRALLLWGPANADPGTFVGVDLKAGDGFGTNRAFRAAKAMFGYAHRFAGGWYLRTLASAYATRFESPGVVRLDDVQKGRLPLCAADLDSQRFCTYDPNQGGALTRISAQAFVTRERELDDYAFGIWGIRQGNRFVDNPTGYVNDVQPNNEDPQRGDGLDQQYLMTTLGASGSWARKWRWWDRPQRFELGARARYDGGEGRIDRLRTSDALPYRTEFANELRQVDIGGYAAFDFRPFDWLDVDAGLRFDAFSYQVVDTDEPTMDRDGARVARQTATAFGFAIQPRVGVTASITPWLDWLAAYGVGSRSSDATALSEGEFAPFARVQAAETGLRFVLAELGDRVAIDARAIGFYTHVDRDLIFDETLSRNVLAGASNRFGALASLRLDVREWAAISGSFTWAEAYLPPQGAGAFDWTAGQRLPYIPRLVVRGDAAVFHVHRAQGEPIGWSAGLGASWVAPRPLPLGQYGTGIAVVDLGASVRWRWIELGLQFRNLFNHRYNSFEYVYPSNFSSPTGFASMLPAQHLSAGEPFNAFATLTLWFEPGEVEDWKLAKRQRRHARAHAEVGS
ncbi:TonB-dependent receptor plug domain-containing protein [Nannocystaceae bacterium ST9]